MLQALRSRTNLAFQWGKPLGFIDAGVRKKPRSLPAADHCLFHFTLSARRKLSACRKMMSRAMSQRRFNHVSRNSKSRKRPLAARGDVEDADARASILATAFSRARSHDLLPRTIVHGWMAILKQVARQALRYRGRRNRHG
jgi:hypothetical protein